MTAISGNCSSLDFVCPESPLPHPTRVPFTVAQVRERLCESPDLTNRQRDWEMRAGNISLCSAAEASCPYWPSNKPWSGSEALLLMNIGNIEREAAAKGFHRLLLTSCSQRPREVATVTHVLELRKWGLSWPSELTPSCLALKGQEQVCSGVGVTPNLIHCPPQMWSWQPTVFLCDATCIFQWR